MRDPCFGEEGGRRKTRPFADPRSSAVAALSTFTPLIVCGTLCCSSSIAFLGLRVAGAGAIFLRRCDQEPPVARVLRDSLHGNERGDSRILDRSRLRVLFYITKGGLLAASAALLPSQSPHLRVNHTFNTELSRA